LISLLLTVPTGGCLRLSGSQSSGDNPDSESVSPSQTAEKNPESESGTGFKIQYADETGTVQTVVDSAGVAAANRAGERNGRYGVSITFTEPAAEQLVTALQNVEAFENPSDHPLFVSFDGQTVYKFQLSRSLITVMESGEFLNNPSLVIRVESESIAQSIVDNLQ
jgi:hypothetical protein